MLRFSEGILFDMRTPVAITIVAFFISVGSLVAVQRPTGAADVQAIVQGPPMALAMVLVNASVPVGLEVLTTDRTAPAKPNFAVEPQDIGDLAAVIDGFNRSHARYHAELLGGVVVIRPMDRKATYLNGPFEAGGEGISGAMSAIRRVFRGLAPRVDSTGGIIGSRFIGPEEAGDYVTVKLDAAMTVLDALNEVARQANQGWLVVTAAASDAEESRIVEVGLIHSRGATSTIVIQQR